MMLAIQFQLIGVEENIDSFPWRKKKNDICGRYVNMSGFSELFWVISCQKTYDCIPIPIESNLLNMKGLTVVN
jgi:hypothetical protein